MSQRGPDKNVDITEARAPRTTANDGTDGDVDFGYKEYGKISWAPTVEITTQVAKAKISCNQ